MPDARDIFGIVFKNGSATLLARIVGGGGNPLVRADVTSIRYSVCLLDPNSPDRQIPVAGHGGISLSVAEGRFTMCCNRRRVDVRFTWLQLQARARRFLAPGLSHRRSAAIGSFMNSLPPAAR